jgi:uncharacterized protein with ParB-like and HNH nuclease domain
MKYTREDLDLLSRDYRMFYARLAMPLTTRIKSFIGMVDSGELQINNNYQRSLVWDLEKKQNYILFLIKGGKAHLAVNLYPYHKNGDREMELVDGQQRLNAITEYLNGEFDVYINDEIVELPENYFRNMEIEYYRMEFKKEVDVVKFYILINSTTSIHSENDLNKAKEYLEKLEGLK